MIYSYVLQADTENFWWGKTLIDEWSMNEISVTSTTMTGESIVDYTYDTASSMCYLAWLKMVEMDTCQVPRKPASNCI